MSQSDSPLRTTARLYWGLLLLRESPEVLPISQPWLQTLLVGYSLGNIAIASLVLPLAQAVVMGVFNTLLVCAATALLLWTRGLGNRLHQTLSALTGCGALLNLLSIPLVWVTLTGPRGAFLPALLNMGMAVWGFLVSVTILRHALSVALEISLLVNIGLFVGYYLLGQQVLRFFN